MEYSTIQTSNQTQMPMVRISPSKSSPKKQSQQLSDSAFSCQLCKKSFSNENTLETHLNSAKHKKLAAEARKTPTSPESKSSTTSEQKTPPHNNQRMNSQSQQTTPTSQRSPAAATSQQQQQSTKQSPKRTPNTTTNSNPNINSNISTIPTTPNQQILSEVQQANLSLAEFRQMKTKATLDKQQQKAIKLLVVAGKGLLHSFKTFLLLFFLLFFIFTLLVFAKSYYLKDSYECYSNLLRILLQQQQTTSTRPDVEKMMIHRSWGVIARILFEIDVSDKSMGGINVIELLLESFLAFVPRKSILDLATSVENHQSILFSQFWNNDVEMVVEKCALFGEPLKKEITIDPQPSSSSTEQQPQPQTPEKTTNIIQIAALKSIRETLSFIFSEQSMHSLSSSERMSKLRLGVALCSILAKFMEKFPTQLEQIGFSTMKDFFECFETLASFYGKLEIYHLQVECWLFLADILMKHDSKMYSMKIKGLVENSLKQQLLSENLKGVLNLLQNEKYKQQNIISPIWIEISIAFMEMNIDTLTTIQEEGLLRNFPISDSQVLISLIEILLQQ